MSTEDEKNSEMSLTLSKSTGEVYRFRNTPLKPQQTFKTPLKDLTRFAGTLLSPFQPSVASDTIDQVVFDPKHLLALLASHGIPHQSLLNAQINAEGRDDITALLEAALGDWVDFLFVLPPNDLVIFADHDEWTTVFAATEAELGMVNAA